MIAPQTEYSQRLEARMQVFTAKEREHIRLGNLKLLVIVAGLIVAWLALRDHKTFFVVDCGRVRRVPGARHPA